MKKIYLLFLLQYFVVTSSNAQTSKYWVGSNAYDICFFDSSSSVKAFPINLFNKVYQGGGAETIQSSNNGDLMFIGSNLRIYDHLGDPIQNSKSVFLPWHSIGLQVGQNSWDILGTYFFDTSFSKNGPTNQLNELKYRFCLNNNCFDSLNRYPFGFYKTNIQRNKENVSFVNEKMKLIDNSISYRCLFLDVKRIRNYKYQLISSRLPEPLRIFNNLSVAVYSYFYKSDSLTIKDSIVFNSYDFLPDSMKSKISIVGHNIAISSAHLNRKRDKLFVSLNLIFPDNYLGLGYKKEIFIQLDLNPTTGQFINSPIILHETYSINSKYKPGTSNRINYFPGYNINNAFSSNDSIMFLNFESRNIIKGETKLLRTGLLAWRYRIQKLSDADLLYEFLDTNTDISSRILYSPNINPFGGLTITYRDKISDIKMFVNFPFSNQPFLGKINHQRFLNSSYSVWSFQSPSMNTYDYIRVKKSPILYKNCGAFYSIKNQSDTSFGLNQFKWYVSKDLQWTQWDTFETKDLPLQFSKSSGKYLFKLTGKCSNGTDYEEIYIDTIELKIPSLVMFDFNSNDTIVCKNNQLNFNNLSKSNDTTNEKYTWDFGDGNTAATRQAIHSYSKSGRFSVKLTYKNTFCDTSVFKSNYILVKEAPVAGFGFDRNRGCAPLSVNVSDTVLQNVKKKEYYFSDSLKWLNIPLSLRGFSHVFTKSGKYLIKQRLTGYSGCVIQKDSSWVYAEQGLSLNDTIHVEVATVELHQTLVKWRSKGPKIRYQLYKNGEFIAIVKDTFFLDISLPIGERAYSVVGIDSCGTSCASGHIGKPVFLEGFVKGNNEIAIIYFSPYLNWNGKVIQYQIQKLQFGDWKTINQTIPHTNFTDLNFLSTSSMQSCYRIRAINMHDTNLQSYSNELCLPYIPTLFIPSAFSPNHDGVNDIFTVNSFGIKYFKLTVLDRWGGIQFRGKENELWDGNLCTDGVYLVIIDYETNEGKIQRQQNSVTLIR